MRVKTKSLLNDILLFFIIFALFAVGFILEEISSNISKTENEIVFPVENGFISSSFGERINPITNNKEIHKGIDIAVPIGTAVISFSDGIVYKIGNDDIYGKYIVIKHSDNVFTKYCHLLSCNVKENDMVETGDRIGKAGNSGWSTGSHLHFEIIRNNKNIDPMKFF